MIFYLDVCCINRPFDDLNDDRVHREALAVETIVERTKKDGWIWLGSQVVFAEIQENPDVQRKLDILRYCDEMSSVVPFNETIENRGRVLLRLGFGKVDALHLASAEHGAADVFLTTDDRLLKKAIRFSKELHVIVSNPCPFIMEWSND